MKVLAITATTLLNDDVDAKEATNRVEYALRDFLRSLSLPVRTKGTYLLFELEDPECEGHCSLCCRPLDNHLETCIARNAA